MRFGPVPLAEAEGAILAHGLSIGAERFRKGRVLSAADMALLAAHGIDTIIAAHLEAGDVGEDVAARRLALACAGLGVDANQAFTGRANLYAATRGLAVLDPAAVDAFNGVDEGVTIATVAPFDLVDARQMLATVKIIPFAVPEAILDAAAARAPRIAVAPFQDKAIGLISTRLPGMKTALLDKNREALAARLAHLSGRIIIERRVDHAVAPLAEAIAEVMAAGAEIVMIFGASAIVDRRDVVPAGIVAAGGEVRHFGMPVDPGNLLLLAALDGRPVIGLPGCARSPKINGFDWVLRRLLADVPVSPADIARMGAGGLLKEIPSRPQPREARPEPLIAEPARSDEAAPRPARAPVVAALLLAAGRSTRMGPTNKLLAEIGGAPLVRLAAQTLLASAARPVIAVTGHMAPDVAARLAGLDLTLVHNPDFAQGLSTSLRAGLDRLPPDIDAVLVALADMPAITAADIDRLIAAFDPDEGRAIVVPTAAGKRGNPVLFDARFIPEMRAIEGDVGARHLIGAHGDLVVEVELGAGAAIDLDTPEALAAFLRRGAA